MREAVLLSVLLAFSFMVLAGGCAPGRHVRLYEVHNNGGWYNFGFVLGAGLFLSGGILGKRRRRRD